MPEENTPINIQTEDSRVFLRHQELIEQYERTAAALRRDLERQIDLRFLAIDRLAEQMIEDIAIRFAARDKADDLAEKVLDARLSEIRGTLTVEVSARDQAARSNATRISKLETGYANLQGRMWAFGVIITFLLTALSVGIHFLPK